MENQQSVFVSCPFVKQSPEQIMQQIQIQIEQDTIQSTIDVCFNLHHLKNLTHHKLGPIQISLSIVANNTVIGIPYQIIPKNQLKSNSKIDLEQYTSPLFIINSLDISVIDEIVIFKIHIPIEHVQTNKLKCIVSLQTINQLIYDDSPDSEEQKTKKLEQIEINFSSILYVQSFFSCFFQYYGILLQGNVHTHLLGCKYGKIDNIYRHHFYQAIDHLVICYNKLRQKIEILQKAKNKQIQNCFQNIQIQPGIISSRHFLSQSPEKQKRQQIILQQEQYDLSPFRKFQEQKLPLFIDMRLYPEYQQIKAFIDKRIFVEQTMKQHRQILHRFVYKFIPEMTEKLLMLWKKFINLAKQDKKGYSQLNQNLFKRKNHFNIKDLYYAEYAYQLKKRIQFYIIPNQKNHSLIKPDYQGEFNRYPSNQGTYYSNQSQKIYFTSNQNNSNRIQINQCNSKASHIWNYQQYQKAENSLRQKFGDKNIFQDYKNKKFSLSTKIQLPCPKLKVCIVQKTERLSKQQVQNNHAYSSIEPHIIVLVHGLGASSVAFKLFEYMLYNVFDKNIYVLNSMCNQNSSNDESIQQMGRKLAIQVYQFISQSGFGQKFQLSFIGHSLGGLIIRSALTKLQIYKFNMKSYITFSTPHLGYFYHNSSINKAGMWAISKISPTKVLDDLLMVAESNRSYQEQQTLYRNSFLYQLSLSAGLSWFENVMVCGSKQDYFVSPLSALINTTQQIMQKSVLHLQKIQKHPKSKIWEQMRFNIQQSIKKANIYKLFIDFSNQQHDSATIKDHLLGRKSHVMYLSSKDLMIYLMLVHKKLFQ